jgi:alpha-tubulin suppressor-like RCC1 family protein
MSHIYLLIAFYHVACVTYTVNDIITVDALRGVGVRQIACGSGHTVVLTTEGEVFTWGRGDDGRLGK